LQNLASRWPIKRLIHERLQELAAEFPTQWNREFLGGNRELFGKEQGIFPRIANCPPRQGIWPQTSILAIRGAARIRVYPRPTDLAWITLAKSVCGALGWHRMSRVLGPGADLRSLWLCVCCQALRSRHRKFITGLVAQRTQLRRIESSAAMDSAGTLSAPLSAFELLCWRWHLQAALGQCLAISLTRREGTRVLR
jgi:hypothetical protein